MRSTTVAIVVAGVLMALALALEYGLDATGLSILALVLGVGAVSIAVATRAAGNRAGPAQCRECGGVISPHAPYCKHCGARTEEGSG